MLQTSGLKDELRETKGEIAVEWTIKDFFTLSQQTGFFYQSAPFFFAGSRWNLRIYPGGDNIQNDTSWISVYIRGHRLERPNNIAYTLGMKNNGGTIEKVVEKSHNFDKNDSASGQQKFFQRSELLRRKAELLPSDDLTITCTLKHTTVKIIEATTKPMKLVELERLSEDFKDLRKRSYDATVKVKDKVFQVHKSVLIARSAVFESMFEHDMSEKKTGVISISDCDPDSFGEFLHYLYTGKAENMTSRSALHLYCTADKYDVKELKSFCVEYLTWNLTVENVCDVVTLAEQYDETELLSAAQLFFNRHVSKILLTVKWEELLQENYRLANKLLREMAGNIKIQA